VSFGGDYTAVAFGGGALQQSHAAAAQQLCSTNPHEAPIASPSALVERSATRGFVWGGVVGIPRWHARGQGFKSPQLHPRSEGLSAGDRPRSRALAQLDSQQPRARRSLRWLQ
jgi:hypothetical protein